MSIKNFLVACILMVGLVFKAQGDDGTIAVFSVVLRLEEGEECPMSTSCGARVKNRLSRIVPDWMDSKLYELGLRFPDYGFEAGGNRDRQLRKNDVCDVCSNWCWVWGGCPSDLRRRRGLTQDADAELVAKAARLESHIEAKAAEALEVLVANRPELSSSCSCALLALQPKATVYF